MPYDKTAPQMLPVRQAHVASADKLSRKFHKLFVQHGPIPRAWEDMPDVYRVLLCRMFCLLVAENAFHRPQVLDHEGAVASEMDGVIDVVHGPRGVTHGQTLTAIDSLNRHKYRELEWVIGPGGVWGFRPTNREEPDKRLTPFEAVALADRLDRHPGA